MRDSHPPARRDRHLLHVLVSLVLGCGAYGCHGSIMGCPSGGSDCSGSTDGGPNADGGGRMDGGHIDGGAVDGGIIDGGHVIDGGGIIDGGGHIDGGIIDGGIIDGGHVIDGGIVDAGHTIDGGGIDGGGTIDGGMDAGSGAPDASTPPMPGRILAPSRRVDWSHAGVRGGIPGRTTVCATLSPGATAADIDAAIAACPSGGVVSLAAGTFNLASGIDFQGHGDVSLRGAGANQTFLVVTGGVTCNQTSAAICVRGDPLWSTPDNLADWTGGLAQGSTEVTLSNVTHLSVGSFIDFDQLNDAADPGDVYVCDAIGTCSLEGTGSVYRVNRAQNQIAMVTAIAGNVVTISPGIYMANWRASQSPQAYWPTHAISGVGIEDLSIDSSGNTTTKAAIAINSATDCWVKNVRSINPNRDHVWLWDTAHITVTDNYFYGTQRGQTSEYGLEPDRDSDSLFTNNIFEHIVSPMMMTTAQGDVYAYNYATDDWYTGSTNWLMPSFFGHATGADLYLLEGNECSGVEGDDVHGSHDLNTVFRNWITGREPAIDQNTIPVNLQSFSRYYNIIGNVLGEPSFHTQYEDLAPSGTNGNHSIYVLGYPRGNGLSTTSAPDDTLVATTLMRWGNYDVVTGATRWDASEVPSGLSEYANPVPADHVLPASFFLSARPSFWTTPWGTPPWPPIGPDVTGGPGPAGHAYDIPAKLCYDHTARDSSGVLQFDAASCYP